MKIVEELREEFRTALAGARTLSELESVRDRFLSRANGRVTALVKSIATAPPEERRTLGALANGLKQDVEAQISARLKDLQASAPVAGAEDITLAGRVPIIGRRHPLALVREKVETIFQGMGYQVVEGPELEDDWHNFEALNMPPEHPARDMQDTLYLAEPVRAPGAQTPMFTQVEGLVEDDGISLGDLNGPLQAFADRFFDGKVRTRFRPSFFPYTEPSAELDVECQGCGGKGCPLCKHTGWIEILGCGMVHPAVFEAVKYDTEKYTGFAFGMGIERLALRLYGVEDIRMFYENDVRFLSQVMA